tara:strand:+ start:219 stop:362 length:144 start_codon:yes stop_codon:yes gene_type:complete
MKKNYIKEILKLFPKISSGRRKFEDYEKRINKNIKLTDSYINKKKKN